MKQLMLVMVVTLMSALQVCAQKAKIADKEIVGSWIMESMQWEGEKKIMCGKNKIKDAMAWIDKTTIRGTWQKRHDIWKKQVNMPEKLRKYIVDCCRMKDTPSDIQQMIKNTMFK